MTNLAQPVEYQPGLIKVTILSDGHFRHIEIPLTDAVMIYAPNGTGKTGSANVLQYLLLEYQKMEGHDTNDSKEHYFPNGRGWVIGYFDTETGLWTGATGLRDGKLTRLIGKGHLPYSTFRKDNGQCKNVYEITGEDLENNIQEASTWGEWEASLAGHSDKHHNIGLFPTIKPRKQRNSPLSTIISGMLQKSFDDDKMRRILVEILGSDVNEAHGTKILASRANLRAKIQEIGRKKAAADRCQATAAATADVPQSSEKLKMLLNGHAKIKKQRQEEQENIHAENAATLEQQKTAIGAKASATLAASEANKAFVGAGAQLQAQQALLQKEEGAANLLRQELELFNPQEAEKEIERLRTEISSAEAKLGKSPQELQLELNRKQTEKTAKENELRRTEQELADLKAGRVHTLKVAWKSLIPEQKQRVGGLLAELESQGKDLHFASVEKAVQFLIELSEQIKPSESGTLEWIPNTAAAHFQTQQTPQWLETGKTEAELQEAITALEEATHQLASTNLALAEAIENRKTAEENLQKKRLRKSDLEKLQTRQQKLELTMENISEIQDKVVALENALREKKQANDATQALLANALAQLEATEEDYKAVKDKLQKIETFFKADNESRALITGATDLVNSFDTETEHPWENHEKAFHEIANLISKLQGQKTHIRSTAEETGLGFTEDEEIWVTWNRVKELGSHGEEERQKERQLMAATKTDVEAGVTESLERFSALSRRVAEFSRTQLASQSVSNITSVKIECEARDPQWVGLLKKFRAAVNHDDGPLFSQGQKSETLMEEIWDKIEKTEIKEARDALSLDYLAQIIFETTNGDAPPKRRESIKGESTGTQMTLRGLILSGLLKEQTGSNRGRIPLLVDEINTVDENNQDILKECCEKIGLVPIVAGPTLPAGLIGHITRVNLENGKGGVVGCIDKTKIVVIEKGEDGGMTANSENSVEVEAA